MPTYDDFAGAMLNRSFESRPDKLVWILMLEWKVRINIGMNEDTVLIFVIKFAGVFEKVPISIRDVKQRPLFERQVEGLEGLASA